MAIMDMDYLVATAQDEIHATMKSITGYQLRRAFNATSAYATREPHSLCGRNDKIWLGTPPAPTHTHSQQSTANSQQQEDRFSNRGRTEETSEVSGQSCGR